VSQCDRCTLTGTIAQLFTAGAGVAKTKLTYSCRACGALSPKWSGQCADCGEWNTLEESLTTASAKKSTRFDGYAGKSVITSIENVSLEEEPRVSSGLGELDRALGGGLVPGSVTLIGGDPGIGKSTLLIQCLAAISNDYPTLYVTGEESLQQVTLRARRLGLPAENLRIQAVYTDALQSAPGSVAQVRESAAHLVRFAKQSNIAMFVVGHVTKEGALAGPRVLEHMVDTVLYFEGDTNSRYRVIRAIKNRFGAVNELGVFVMEETGLRRLCDHGDPRGLAATAGRSSGTGHRQSWQLPAASHSGAGAKPTEYVAGGAATPRRCYHA